MSRPLSVANLDYIETTRNVDNMLAQFNKDRDSVVKMMDTNINELIDKLWTPDSPVCIDNGCLFNMGKSLDQNTLEDRIEGNIVDNEGMLNYYICPQCVNMKRILDVNKTKIGQPFHLECGDSAGSQLIMTETDISSLYMISESPPSSVARALKNPHINEFNKCSLGCDSGDVCKVPNYSKMNYVGSDPFTNNMLINWYLNSKLEELCIPNLIKMEIAFVCSGKGYCLYEYPDIGRIRHLQEYPEYLEHREQPSPTAKADDKVPISKDTVRGIIMQLFAVLHALRRFNFSHGGPSSRSILFKKETCSYLYDGVHVEGPLTIKLYDLYHSGISLLHGDNRLYNKSIVADEELLRSPFRPIIENSNKNSIYRLKNPNRHFQEALLFMYIKHLGLPIYQASFDAYAYMIALMAERSFYATVMSNEGMYDLWKNMWLPEEFEIIQDRILKLHDSADPVTRVDKIFRILSGFGLRCNMIDYGWGLIKKW